MSLPLHVRVRHHVSRLFWAASLARWPDAMSLAWLPTQFPPYLCCSALATQGTPWWHLQGAGWHLGWQQHPGCHSAPVNAAGAGATPSFSSLGLTQAQGGLYPPFLLTWGSWCPWSLSQH